MARDDYYMGSLAGLDAYRGDEPAWPPAPPTYPGMKEWGNIDLNARPTVRNPDGSISTVRSMGVNIDNAETLIPTVHPSGRIMSDEEAIDHYRKTGQHLGRFDTPANSDAYAEALHNSQAEQYVKPQPMGAVANPWADFMSRDQPLPTHAPERPLTRGEFVAGALGAIPGNILKSTFGAAAAKLKPNPHPPGSEEAQDYESRAGAQNYEFGPEVAQMMVGTGTFAGPKSMLGTGGSNIVQPIRAYHSSPHDFEKFDASKIGTGQGAASYGVGHYLAENPKVSGQGGEYWNEFLRHNNFPQGGAEQRAAELLRRYNFDRAKALADEELNINLKHPLRVEDLGVNATESPEYAKALVTQRQKLHQDTKRLLEGSGPIGPRTYEVDIHARPEQFLDWDKTIAPKTPVREMIADLGMKGTGSVYPDARNAAKDAFLAAQSPNLTGEGAYRSLVRANFDAPVGKATVRASDQLREAGIPGIRYLDQGSRMQAQATPEQIASLRMSIASKEEAHRNTPWLIDTEKNTWGARNLEALQEEKRKLEAALNPTSNYVIFPGNEHLLRIAKKYGLAGAVPTTMGALAARDRYAQ